MRCGSRSDVVGESYDGEAKVKMTDCSPSLEIPIGSIFVSQLTDILNLMQLLDMMDIRVLKLTQLLERPGTCMPDLSGRTHSLPSICILSRSRERKGSYSRQIRSCHTYTQPIIVSEDSTQQNCMWSSLLSPTIGTLSTACTRSVASRTWNDGRER